MMISRMSSAVCLRAYSLSATRMTPGDFLQSLTIRDWLFSVAQFYRLKFRSKILFCSVESKVSITFTSNFWFCRNFALAKVFVLESSREASHVSGIFLKELVHWLVTRYRKTHHLLKLNPFNLDFFFICWIIGQPS